MNKKFPNLFFSIAISALLLSGCGGENNSAPENSIKVDTRASTAKSNNDIRAMRPAPVASTLQEKTEILSAFKLPHNSGLITFALGKPTQAETTLKKTSGIAISERQYQIGFSRNVTGRPDHSPDASKLHWMPLPTGGQVASLSITSTAAAAVRIGLLVTRMPNATEIRFAGSDNPSTVVGPILAGRIQLNQTYWSPALDGDTVTMEIFLPSGSSASDLDFKIVKISHLVSTPSNPRNINVSEKGASYCEVDLACANPLTPELEATGSSAAKMIFTKTDGNSYLCSGTLINNVAKDPLFFSANHCISDQETASTLNTYWFYQSSSCGGGLKQVVHLFNGATLLYHSTQDDFLLLKLNDSPPASANFAGWDAKVITPQNVIGIHHPHGDIKKISSGATDANFTIVNDKGLYTPVVWQSGITEPGSSGSGLFTYSDGYYALRGALYAGSSTCASPSEADYFSRFDLVYDSIKEYLTTKTAPQTGWWWNPNEGGRGFTIEILNNKMFFAGYLYDESGRATWVASGPTLMSSSSMYHGVLTSYKNGQTLNGKFQPATQVNTGIGNIDIVFSDATHGTLTWPGGVVAIQRYDIVPGGVSAPIPANTPETGWWWNPSEGGRGFSIEIQNGNMFLAGYMYDANGNPVWYASGPMSMTNAGTYNGFWQQYANGQTLNGSFKPASVINNNVGKVSINFSDRKNAILTLPNNTQIAITRYVF